MTSPFDTIHGCEVNFPDTAFLDGEEGMITEVIKNDKDGFLISVKNPSKLKP